MENITITIPMEKYQQIRVDLGEHKVKEIRVVDDLFKDDPVHKELKESSDKAYKRLMVYEWDKRNK